MTAPDTLALVVREDVRDTVRERQFHLLVGIYVLLGLLVTYAAARSASASGSEAELVSPLVALFALLTPLLALGFFAAAIVERRASGALKVVLGLPIDRETVVLGTFLGRSAVICTAVFTSLVAAVPLAVLLDVAVDPVAVAATAVLLSLLGVTFTALAVAISALVRTSTRATIGAFGAFVCFYFDLWSSLPLGVLYLRHGFSLPETTPEWVEVVSALNPVAAYAAVFEGLFPDRNSGTFVTLPPETAFYHEPAFGLVVLAGWIVVAIGLGAQRFRTTDL